MGERDAQVILTPDPRLQVFISSTIGEPAEERVTASRAIEDMRMHPILFELGARPLPPRDLYCAYLAQSDIFVGIYWQSYGWVAPEMPTTTRTDRLKEPHDRLTEAVESIVVTGLSGRSTPRLPGARRPSCMSRSRSAEPS